MMAIKVFRSGTWLYDGVVIKPVDIIGLDYDFWYDLHKVDGLLSPEDKPEPLSDDGWLYYARFRYAGEHSEPTWVDSDARKTIVAAMNDAEKKSPSQINWT